MEARSYASLFVFLVLVTPHNIFFNKSVDSWTADLFSRSIIPHVRRELRRMLRHPRMRAADLQPVPPLEDFVLFQDNASWHGAAASRTWGRQPYRVLKHGEWPPRSPDLNVIENCFSWLGSQLAGLGIRTNERLKREATRVWMSLPMGLIENLWGSIPRRLRRVIERDGSHCGY